ncbi:MAG: hypothetical protein V4649_09300 [Bacteroidota bacterium]
MNAAVKKRFVFFVSSLLWAGLLYGFFLLATGSISAASGSKITVVNEPASKGNVVVGEG